MGQDQGLAECVGGMGQDGGSRPHRCLVRAPPCGYCPDDCYLYYKTETGVLSGAAGDTQPLGLLASSPSQRCVPAPLSNLPAQGLSHALSLIQIPALPCPAHTRAEGSWTRGPGQPSGQVERDAGGEEGAHQSLGGHFRCSIEGGAPRVLNRRELTRFPPLCPHQNKLTGT